MELTTSYLVVGAVALALLLVFLLVRGVVSWLGRRLGRPAREPSLLDNLPEHLAALQPPKTLAERLDRTFTRMIGQSSLNLSGAQALGWLLVAGVAGGGGLFLWREEAWLLGAGFVLAAGLTVGFFAIAHQLWMHQVQQQLPDVFYLLARSLRAGLTLDQSLALIASQGQPPLAGEFRRCAEHLRLGLTVPVALTMTAERIGLEDFNLFASLLTIHRQTGGNLALLLDRLAATVRGRNQFRGHVRAVTALGRLSGLGLALGAPLLMVVYWILYPDYLRRLTEGPQGVAALTTALVLEVVGVVWLLFLIRVDH